ncbi:MAG: M48 family metalloprotease [Armatimonadetes bacterium]|nr:M48 family metalloprotease [Armatimonadota bacterium]
MYEQIARNKRHSALLVLAVVILLMVLGAVFAGAVEAPWWTGLAGASVAAGITFLISYYGGSAILLGVSGARPIQKRDHPQLFNVVEEMAIASGLPMPRIYIIEDSAPNAFATGRSPDQAAIAVTRGLLNKLSRDELQGVIAHEMAHIQNFDIRLSMLLAVLVGSIALLCDLFLRMVRHVRIGGDDDDRGSAGLQVFFLALGLLLAIVAPIFAKLLELAVSRRREYLADATGALLTRYPEGLASALQKISDDPEVLEVANRATQHLYIINPIKSFEERAAGLFDTHPPIQDRIRRLHEMAFKGDSRPASAVSTAGSAAPTVSGAASAAASAIAGTPGPAPAGLPDAEAPLPPAATDVTAAADVLKAVGPLAAAAHPPCPRCQEPLLTGGLGRFPMFGCRQCGGIWLGGAAFETLLREAPEKLDAADHRFPNLIGYGWDRVSGRKCPTCAQALVPYQVTEPAALWLDRCPQCSGLWFDDGELSAIAGTARREQQVSQATRI